uniref:acrosomal protein SP-10 n=1 Tax=Jaculus jaculus TaxID=51337 RepID=UPI001E1B0818|nr:acrosomal protein SP-10 [Jaculus jaculus]
MEFILLLSLYLLGSVRGAPGQPDKPLEFINNHASVQQLSSEYFSLANPSDIEALEESSGEKILTERSSSEHDSSEHAASEHAAGEHVATENAGEHMSGEQPSGEQPSGEQALGEEASGEHSSDQSAGEQAAEEKSTGEHASGEGEHQQPSGELAAAEQPAGEQPSADQVSAEQPAVEQATGEQPSSTTFSSTSPGTSLNCHTCAYMTNQGKCLRGEGICAAQSSQQCMLKKIFEGGNLQFMVQACENMCPSMNLLSHGTRMQIVCCRNKHFCNAV